MALRATDMADAIEREMAQAWQDVKNVPMPASDPLDRRPMFLAIARGVIGYLQANLRTPSGGQVGTLDLTLSGTTTHYTVTSLALDVS